MTSNDKQKALEILGQIHTALDLIEAKLASVTEQLLGTQ